MKLTIRHTASSIIHDPQFIEWIVSPTDELNDYWNDWLKNNPGKQSEVDEARFLVNNFIRNEGSLSQKEISELWIKIDSGKTSHSIKLVLLKRWFAAASILLVLGLTGLIATHFISSKTSQVDYKSIAIAKDNSNEVKLILSDQSEKTFTSKDVKLKYNEKGEVETADGKIEKMRNSSEETDKMNQLIVPRGKRSNIVLADGTKLWLNSGSRAIYPVVFNKKFREIFIEGEAYLEVQRNPEKPFFVVTDKMKIKVLGTRFNINSYQNEDFSSVVLVEGSLLAMSGNQKNLMKPNQILSCDNRTGITSVREGDVRPYISWKDGWLLCNQEKIGKVMTKLERYYDVNIDADDERINSMTLSGKLELKDSLQQVLTIICKTAPIKFEQINHTIRLSIKK